MVEISQVETFDETAAQALTEPIFGDAGRQQCMRELIGAQAEERAAGVATRARTQGVVRVAGRHVASARALTAR